MPSGDGSLEVIAPTLKEDQCCGTCRHAVWPKERDTGICQGGWWEWTNPPQRPFLLSPGCGHQCLRWAPKFESYGLVIPTL